jgi:hypothetical protein
MMIVKTEINNQGEKFFLEVSNKNEEIEFPQQLTPE